MGKAERNRELTARAKIAAQQAAARRAEARRRSLIAGGGVLLVVVLVVVLIVVKALQPKPATPKAQAARSDATVAREITTVPASTLNAVGAGPTGKDAVTPLTSISGAPLTIGGKPEVLYIGAEYCPFCGAERWAMTVALSRFGSFAGLHFTHSSSTDLYARTPTLTFYQSTYTSKYLTFVPVETETTTYKALQAPTAAEQAIMNKYDPGGYFPFVDVGNKYTITSAQYLPSTLGTVYGPGVASPTALTWAQVASDLQNPDSPVAKQVLGAANHITAAICKITNGQPGSVCSAPAVRAVGRSI